jgi:hypothetical protein
MVAETNLRTKIRSSSVWGVTLAPSRECVFCGGTTLTKEHVWPQWLKNQPAIGVDQLKPFPRRPHVSPRSTRSDFFTGPITEAVVRGEEQPPHLLTVRVVCATCNNGWMASREATAQRILTPLMAGSRTDIDRGDLVKIAAWATKTAMMAEYCQPEGLAFTASQRSRIRMRERPPHAVSVWIGRYDGGRRLVIRHFSGAVQALEPDGRLLRHVGRVGFTLLIPHTVALLVTSSTPEIEPEVAEQMLPPWLDGAEWRKLWPSPPDGLTWWDDVPRIGEDEVDRLSVGYENLPGGPRAL